MRKEGSFKESAQFGFFHVVPPRAPPGSTVSAPRGHPQERALLPRLFALFRFRLSASSSYSSKPRLSLQPVRTSSAQQLLASQASGPP